MSMNDSILLVTGLKDANINFIFSSDGSFNKFVYHDKYQRKVLLYQATLSIYPHYCPQCGLTLKNNIDLAGTESDDYLLFMSADIPHVLKLTKQRFQCHHCKRTFISQSNDLINLSKIS